MIQSDSAEKSSTNFKWTTCTWIRFLIFWVKCQSRNLIQGPNHRTRHARIHFQLNLWYCNHYDSPSVQSYHQRSDPRKILLNKKMFLSWNRYRTLTDFYNCTWSIVHFEEHTIQFQLHCDESILPININCDMVIEKN